MKMTAKNLFPLTEPNPKFREQLKLEILEVYNQQRQPRFNWRWLVAPGVAFTSLLLVVLVGGRQPFSQLLNMMKLNQPELIQSDVLTQPPRQVQEGENSWSPKLVETPQTLDQLDQELSELSDSLSADSDLEAAISFSNL